MPKPSGSRTKVTPPPVASVEVNEILTPEIETLREQLLESQAQTAILQAALEERTSPRAILARSEIDYDQLAAAMQRLRDNTDATVRTAQPAAPPATRSAKQADPTPLSDGTDPTFTSWSILVLAKLRDNHDHFPSENSKLTYVYGRTAGDAQRHLEPRFEPGSRYPFQTVDEVIAFLASIYQNPLRQAIAQDQYYDLRQGRTEPFSEFLTEF